MRARTRDPPKRLIFSAAQKTFTSFSEYFRGLLRVFRSTFTSFSEKIPGFYEFYLVISRKSIIFAPENSKSTQP